MNNEIKYVSPFKKLCITVGNLPTAYIESMSYYEGLTFLVNYLSNNVIPALNNNGQVVNELKDYVENYFENLDVQEEINNKLDEMAESGELQDIITAYLQVSGVLAYNTVTDMKVADNLINGSIAKTLGFNNSGDGGSALYKIRTITNDDIVNEKDIIALSDPSLIAELISDKYNVMCYGVTVNDDNNDNNSIIEYVISKMKHAYIKESITIKSPIHLNINNTSLDFYNLIYSGNNAAIWVEGYNIKINGQKITSANNGIKVGGTILVSCLTVNINEIEAESNGLAIGGTQGVQDSQFTINRIEYKNHGILFDLSQKWVGQVGFYDTIFADNSDSSVTENYAIYMDCSNNGMTGLDLYNISMEGAKGGIYVTTTGNVTSKFLEHLNIYGCRLSEFSLNNKYKMLKLITPHSQNNITLEGEIHFDSAYITSFDLSEYYSVQGCLKLYGLLKTENLTTLVGRSTIGLEASLGHRKVLIHGSNKSYDNVSINDDTSIIVPRANNIILRAQNHTVGLKLSTSEFNYIGEYSIYAYYDCTLNILNDAGTVVRTYTLTPSNLLVLRSSTSYWDTGVQITGEVISSVWVGSAN